MELSDYFWNASLTELKQGYIEEKDHYLCLLCGEKVEKGVVYPYQEKFYEAEKYVRVHIETTHQSVFEYLIGMDKKLTGLTDHQRSLLRLFYQGKRDREVQEELEIGSASTIRHHRFALKEKERQAKTFLALMELLKEKDEHAPAFVPVHKNATMVDERYNITEDEQAKMIKKFFAEGNKLVNFPPKQKQRVVVLREITKHLKTDYRYSEKELNETLKEIYEDYVTVRRYLVDYGYMNRKPDGSEYWLSK